MATYAALVSLMNTVEQIHSHPRYSVSLDKKQVMSLGETVSFLEGFVENSSNGGGPEAEVLERRIASAAHAAEDVIETHIVDQIHADCVSLLDLKTVIEEMDSAKEMATKVEEERRLIKAPRPSYLGPAASLTPLASGKSTMVGPDDELIHLMDVLTGEPSSRHIIPITGMGGIGKTTLARNAYENSLIVQRFDFRLWVAISQEYSLRGILLELLSCIIKPTSELDKNTDGELGGPVHKTDGELGGPVHKTDKELEELLDKQLGKLLDKELGELLYKRLYGRRYMIVMDDMWSIEAWDAVMSFFPDTNNGSRIVVTTRESNLATHLAPTYLQKKFLDEGASWNLFCEKAFAQECCPPELEAIGKKIVKKCGGLPLSIAVIGGLLGKSFRAQEYWENIVQDINSMLSSGVDGQFSEILSLSYRYLPARLKPCFLYMGIFPEDYEIHVSGLIQLWVAEGFIKSNKAQSLEEVAEGNFKDLVDRNLIIVRRLRSSGKIKTCYIHDLLRDMCLRLAEKEKFLSNMRSLNTPRDFLRRTLFQELIPEEYKFDLFYHDLHSSASLARSFISCDERPWWSRFRLLRVLHVFGKPAYYCRSQPLIRWQPINLRYFCHPSFVPCRTFLSSVSLLWNVQTLIIRARDTHDFPSHLIWQMPKLRHLKINEISLPHPPRQSDQQDAIVLQNLQTLEVVKNFTLSEEACKAIPNLKKLKMTFDNDFSSIHDYCLSNLDHLHKLESLNCDFQRISGWGNLQKHTLPASLKKFTLIHFTNFHLDDFTIIGRLPHLEVLVIKDCYCIGRSEWNPVEGEFCRLKSLDIECGDNMKHWNADSSHFPVLETLILRHLSYLHEIPSGVREIPTLRLIYLQDCSESATIAAARILEEQESLGNEDLQVQVQFSSSDKLESFRETMEDELRSFTSSNLHLKVVYQYW